jgi:hypothetical protein
MAALAVLLVLAALAAVAVVVIAGLAAEVMDSNSVVEPLALFQFLLLGEV